ncbi:MAG: glycosyl transferase group 1 [Fibrobacteria bacterium]|jgi:glycosyltransferase involved in cell wall biosynthesis|nr:glycosyl transferase group 1 [Fibrobacteria bacterium]
MPTPGAPGPRPRILIVNWRDIRNPAAGGAELHLQEVARRLVRDGFPCVQYAHAFPGCRPVETVDGVEIHRAGGPFLFNYTALFGLRRWIRRHRIDVVIDDSNKIPFLLPWISPVPVVARFHHLFGAAIFRETNPLSALYVFLFEGLIRFAYRGVPVLTVSPSTRAELEAKGLRDIAVAVNGVDPERYRVLPGAVRDPFLIVHVGRLMRYKNVDTLLRAFAILRRTLPEARLVIGGDGNHRASLEKQARDLAIADAVEFRGFVAGDEKIRLYNEAAVFVNPSLKEGWGLTSIEANACGAPVVAADSPGLRDSVRHGETGLRVPPLDAEAFASAIASILENPGLAARLRAGALEWAAAHGWERTFAVTREVLLRAWKGREAA